MVLEGHGAPHEDSHYPRVFATPTAVAVPSYEPESRFSRMFGSFSSREGEDGAHSMIFTPDSDEYLTGARREESSTMYNVASPFSAILSSPSETSTMMNFENQFSNNSVLTSPETASVLDRDSGLFSFLHGPDAPIHAPIAAPAADPPASDFYGHRRTLSHSVGSVDQRVQSLYHPLFNGFTGIQPSPATAPAHLELTTDQHVGGVASSKPFHTYSETQSVGSHRNSIASNLGWEQAADPRISTSGGNSWIMSGGSDAVLISAMNAWGRPADAQMVRQHQRHRSAGAVTSSVSRNVALPQGNGNGVSGAADSSVPAFYQNLAETSNSMFEDARSLLPSALMTDGEDDDLASSLNQMKLVDGHVNQAGPPSVINSNGSMVPGMVRPPLPNGAPASSKGQPGSAQLHSSPRILVPTPQLGVNAVSNGQANNGLNGNQMSMSFSLPERMFRVGSVDQSTSRVSPLVRPLGISPAPDFVGASSQQVYNANGYHYGLQQQPSQNKSYGHQIHSFHQPFHQPSYQFSMPPLPESQRGTVGLSPKTAMHSINNQTVPVPLLFGSAPLARRTSAPAASRAGPAYATNGVYVQGPALPIHQQYLSQQHQVFVPQMHLQHLPLASSASIPRVDGDLHSSSSTAFERSSPPDPALSWSPTSLSSESPSTPPSKLLFGDGNEFPQIPTSAQSSSASLPTSISASSIVDSVNNQGTDNISTTPPISPVAPAVPVPATNLAIVREIQTSKLRVDDKILTKEYFDQLTREVRELCAEVCPTPDEARRQEVVFESLEELAKKVFPEAQLHHFGSTANGFSLAGADMDLCLSIPDANKLNLAQCVEKLGHALKGAGMKDVKMLTRARVPIVKMRDPFTGIRCDIGFQNSLAVFNTKLLKTYSDIDPRFRELVLVVKHWSKRRNINEPYFGTLSSYCYVLMVIHLLQVRGVLPCLQRIKPKSFTGLNGTPCDMDSEGIPVMEVDGHNVYFYDEVGRLDEHWKCQNDESLGELLVALFKYYSAEFPYVHGVASVRTGKVLSKEEKGWTKERQQELNRNGAVKDRYWLCVEDPFEVSNNIGRPVDKETLYEVRGEFIRASKLLCAGGGSSGVPENVLGRVCEKNLKKVSMNGTGNGVSVQTNMPGVGGNGVHPISPLGPTAPTSVMMSNGMSGGVVTGGMGLPVGNGYRKW